MLASQTGVSVQVLAALLLFQLLANASGKGVADSLGPWVPATHGGYQHGVSGSWLQPGPLPDLAAI